MFELMLMRHAKSDWHSHTADVDRPLNGRGGQDAVRMGAHLNEMGLIPDKIVISVAQRAQETAELLLNNLAVPEEQIIVDDNLYLAGMTTLCDIIALHAVDNQRLLILAHNPGMDDLVSYLASAPPPLTASGNLMTTCAVACFYLGSLDALTRQGSAELQRLIRPGELTE